MHPHEWRSVLPNRLDSRTQAGLDSLAAVELRNAVSQKFGVVLPVTVTFDYPTASALAGFVATQVAPVVATGLDSPRSVLSVGRDLKHLKSYRQTRLQLWL